MGSIKSIPTLISEGLRQEGLDVPSAVRAFRDRRLSPISTDTLTRYVEGNGDTFIRFDRLAELARFFRGDISDWINAANSRFNADLAPKDWLAVC